MGFKLPGKSMTSGTSAHSSALKMRTEQIAASALKLGKKGLYASDMSWKEGAAKAETEGNDLNALTKARKGLKKGSFEYNKVQNKINSALGNKKRYDEGPAAEEVVVNPTKKEQIVEEGKEDRVNIVDKAEVSAGEKIEKNPELSDLSDLGKLDTYKTERGLVRSQQKEDRKLATTNVKEARATYGRGSDEVKAAKADRKSNRKAGRVERRTMRKDQRANKAVQRAERKGTEKSIKRAAKLNKKAEDYATTSHKGNIIGD